MSDIFPEATVVLNKPDRSLKLEDFSYLWKLDDPGWVAQREADWLTFLKPIFQDRPKEDQKLLEQYFKRGKKDEYYPASGWFFLTPYDSKESLMKLINSSLLGRNERLEIIAYYILNDFFRFSSCPWYREHMEILMAAFYTNGYHIIKEQKKIISPPPTGWCKYFVESSIDSIKNGISWRPFYNCVDYFVSILPFAYRIPRREEIRLEELMQLVDDKLDNGGLEGEVLTFVQMLKASQQAIQESWDIGEQKIAAGMEAPREG